jgi:20S proteasome alpha/beta subunit
MQEWHDAYAQGTAPELSYLMVASALGEQEIYLLEPPRTFVAKKCFSIGSGARTAQPLLEMVTPWASPRASASLLYLLYEAKHAEQETAFVGGGFDSVYIPKAGPQIWIDPRDITTAYNATLGNRLLPFYAPSFRNVTWVA